MPKIGGKRRKNRTHKENEDFVEDATIGKIPKSFIFKRGPINKPIREIVSNMRDLMYPYTAMKLKESDKTKLKEYISASGVYGITNMFIFTSTKKHNYIRFIKNPDGPTITCKILSYCTNGDVINSLKNKKSFSRQFAAPLIVLNGFNKPTTANVKNPPSQDHYKIVSQMLQSLFPPLSLKKAKVNSLKRVALFSYDAEKDLIFMRQYHIELVQTSANKGVKKLLNDKSKLPNLRNYQNFSSFLNKGTVSGGGYVSESDAEDIPDSKIQHEVKSIESKTTKIKKQFQVKLTEMGPRLKLRLHKIEEGLLGGNVIYNRQITKTPQEAEKTRKTLKKKLIEKEQRKKEQQTNVQKKLAAVEEKKRLKQEKYKKREEEASDEEDDGEEDGQGEFYSEEIVQELENELENIENNEEDFQDAEGDDEQGDGEDDEDEEEEEDFGEDLSIDDDEDDEDDDEGDE